MPVLCTKLSGIFYTFKTCIMIHVVKTIFVTLMLTLALHSSIGQLTHPVELSLDRTTHLLSEPARRRSAQGR